MKKIFNLKISESLNRGKEDILYENTDELREAYPSIRKVKIWEMSVFKHPAPDLIHGYVKSDRHTEEKPDFIYVDDTDEWREMLDTDIDIQKKAWTALLQTEEEWKELIQSGGITTAVLNTFIEKLHEKGLEITYKKFCS
jgi:hypothetical protein